MLFSLGIATYLCRPTAALALTLPDTGTCPSTMSQTTCLNITSNKANNTGLAVFAQAGSSYGIFGNGSFVGVKGAVYSAGALAGVHGYTDVQTIGVYGQATGAGYGVYGENTSSNGFAGRFAGNFIVTGIPYANQSTFTVTSDARLKRNVKPLTGSLEQLLRLRGVTYEWRDPSQHGSLTGPQVGFIAQEVEGVFPSWVSPNRDGFKTVTMRGFEPMVVESLRALKAQNDQLQARLKAIESSRQLSRAGVLEGPLSLAAFVLAVALVIASRRRSKA